MLHSMSLWWYGNMRAWSPVASMASRTKHALPYHSRNRRPSSHSMPEFVFAAIWQMCNVHCAYIPILKSRPVSSQQSLDTSYVACTRWITLIIYLYKDFGRCAEWYKHICNFSCNNLFAYTTYIPASWWCAVVMGEEMLVAVQYLRSKYLRRECW